MKINVITFENLFDYHNKIFTLEELFEILGTSVNKGDLTAIIMDMIGRSLTDAKGFSNIKNSQGRLGKISNKSMNFLWEKCNLYPEMQDKNGNLKLVYKDCPYIIDKNSYLNIKTQIDILMKERNINILDKCFVSAYGKEIEELTKRLKSETESLFPDILFAAIYNTYVVNIIEHNKEKIELYMPENKYYTSAVLLSEIKKSETALEKECDFWNLVKSSKAKPSGQDIRLFNESQKIKMAWQAHILEQKEQVCLGKWEFSCNDILLILLNINSSFNTNIDECKLEEYREKAASYVKKADISNNGVMFLNYTN